MATDDPDQQFLKSTAATMRACVRRWKTDHACSSPSALLADTVRAATHLDLLHLERQAFEAVMRDHPAGALSVADSLRKILPPQAASRAAMEIYDSTGLRDMLQIFQRKWVPPKGLAGRIKATSHVICLNRAAGVTGV